MESIAHSRQPNKVSATLSKKINNGNHGGLSAKGLYDDVYGGPPKFGVNTLSPRFEDYSEIFGGFHTARASSIPLLDLPMVDENEVFFDVRSSGFDYGEVFGGFDGLDFAVSYEDLFHQPSLRDGVSSDEAWTPAETDSFSGESDHSGNNLSMSKGDHYQSSLDGGTEFNISYHKVNGTRNRDMLKEKTHVTELQAVHGFTLVFDEATPMHSIDPSLQFPDDINFGMDLNADKVRSNLLGETISHPHNHTSGEQTCVDDLELDNGYSKIGSHSRETFVTVSDISLRTRPSQVPPPSRPPPVLDSKNGDTGDLHLNAEQVPSAETPGDSSPPFFDVEVDMNSSAAAPAEAKLRSAKDLKERKKEGFESCAKSSYDVKNNEGHISGNINRSSNLKDERIQGTSDRRCSKVKISVTDERQKAMKLVLETPDSLEGEKLLHMPEKSVEEKHINESRSSQGSDKSTQAGTWKEETEFFELVGTEESPNVFQPLNHTKSSAQDSGIREHGWKANLQEESKKEKATEENCQIDEYKKKSKAAKEAYEQDKSIRRYKASHEEVKQREYAKKEKVAKLSEQEESENLRMAHQHCKTEKKRTHADHTGKSENIPQTQQRELTQMEGEKPKEVDRLDKVHHAMRLKENNKNLKEVEKQRESMKKHKQTEKLKENERREIEAFALGKAKGEEKLRESVEMEEADGTFKEANKKGLKEAHEREEIEKSLKDAFGKEGDETRKQALDQERSDKRLKESFELEVNDITLKEALEHGKNDKRVKEAYERNQNKKTFKEPWDGYEIENRLQESGVVKGVQKVLNQGLERVKNSRILKEAQRKEETESSANQEFDREGSAIISNADSQQEISEKVLDGDGGKEKDKRLDKALEPKEGNEDGNMQNFAEEIDGIWETEFDPIRLVAQSASFHKENVRKLEESQESNITGRKTRAEFKVGEKKLEEVGMENLMSNTNSTAPEVIHGDLEYSGTQPEKVDDSVTTDDGVGFGSKQTGIEKTNAASQLDIDPRDQDRKLAHEWGERGKNNQHVKIAPILEESMDQAMSSHANLCDHNRRNTEAAGPATVQETESSHKIATRLHAGQSTERKEKDLNENLASEEKDADRMAVDRATLQARDRAFAEARERAAFERATTEARQRALTEARERLEKACAEARDKSFADKASTEARLKAERAAVERATAEARERAMEKAKVERAAFESRERLERSVSDNFGPSSRNGGRQGFSSSVSIHIVLPIHPARYDHNKRTLLEACTFSERSEGGEGESAQRHRARLERYRRTAERAAKALAEKNMRDLLAQKEQAERNRLAETLDAEVRRWSSGKEGNLRALLSTLQYILGPDSGWQPIPLTEVITSAAVKKAYRKATLCVHPDKLQQRGASIQHKYICEKVFDLLKEAWNKFNSEER
ncbi:Auxilin-like protein 1 [Senna tora]|uniref:Auxilin-like protein 1 n=1 Tax=Senna tora TaxID=362788 RepID=A0A834TX73_9FABA|nr:Auxilin-like protein 1 [Senna tora]